MLEAADRNVAEQMGKLLKLLLDAAIITSYQLNTVSYPPNNPPFQAAGGYLPGPYFPPLETRLRKVQLFFVPYLSILRIFIESDYKCVYFQ